ncbi:hypothetical protein E4U54_002055 [Claviceps lovelessii]|nr:hypothetical protein E4U54_002055 [Claviceps lovelessii]
MLLLAVLLATPLALASSASSTSSLPLPTVQVLFFGDKFPLVGSVIGTDAAATTLAVQCASGTASENCGLPAQGVIFTQGPRTCVLDVTRPPETDTAPITMNQNCKLDPSADMATCTAVVSSENHAIFSSQTVLSGYASMMFPVTITAGADKLTASAGATASAVTSISSLSSTITATATATATSTATNAAMLTMPRTGALLAGVAGVVASVLAL